MWELLAFIFVAAGGIGATVLLCELGVVHD